MRDFHAALEKITRGHLDPAGRREQSVPRRKPRKDLRGCSPCRKKMLAKMKAQQKEEKKNSVQGDGGGREVTQINTDKTKEEKNISMGKEEKEISVHPRASAAPLKLASVITAFDEGDEVQITVDSLAGSINHHGTTLKTFLIDDSSKDGSCEKLSAGDSLVTIRHDESEGVGRSRNAGTKAALDGDADVVSFHDAHMRFPGGVLEALAQKAIETGAIICSAARGWW